MLSVMATALEAAWKTVSAADPGRDLTRLRLAGYILSVADKGIHDPNVLAAEVALLRHPRLSKLYAYRSRHDSD